MNRSSGRFGYVRTPELADGAVSDSFAASSVYSVVGSAGMARERAGMVVMMP